MTKLSLCQLSRIGAMDLGLRAALLFVDSVTLGKRFHLSEPQFYHWKSEGLLKQSVVVDSLT